METRKRKSPLENYLHGLTEEPERKKTVAFYTSLHSFYKRKWNATLKLPCVQGVEVNLYRLYTVVMSLGGWQKVANQERWPEVAEMFGIGDDIMGGDFAIKLIYMRYLSKYEQVETVGEVDDMMMDGEMSRSRGRIVSFFANNENPMGIGRTLKHIRRDERGNTSIDPDYSRVFCALLSGLPNEVDFAMNICTLLSHPGPRLLHLAHAPHLITLLVAHCGVFDDEDADLSDLYEAWRSSTSRDFGAFWAASQCPKEFLEKFAPHALNRTVDDDSELLTGLTLEYDVKDPISWRLNQVATILRNFSFETINRVSMTESWPLMKFLFLCASSRWVPLFTAALDTLSNLACDLNMSWHKLTHNSEHALLRLIHDGMKSLDKFKLMRCMEIVTGLCQHEGNETILCDFFSTVMFRRIFELVCVKDIMMCVYALECLYQISEMGSSPCEQLASLPDCVSQLVSMATLEAVSFGQSGLSGMKVVEYQQPMIVQQQSQQQAGTSAGGPLGAPGMTPNPQHQQQRFAGQTPTTHGMTPRAPPPSANMATPRTNGPSQLAVSTGTAAPAGESKVEQLTEQWIKANCVADATSVTPRGELYAAYVDDLRNQYHSLSGSLQLFSNVMKFHLPDVVFRMADNGLMMVAQGIRLVKPHKLAPTASNPAMPSPGGFPNQGPSNANYHTGTSHPLMKQILQRPASPTLPAPEIPVQLNGHMNGISKSNSNDSSRSNTPVDDKQTPEVRADTVLAEPRKLENGLTNGNHNTSVEGLKNAVVKRTLTEEKDKRVNDVAMKSSIKSEVREKQTDGTNDKENMEKLDSTEVASTNCNGMSSMAKSERNGEKSKEPENGPQTTEETKAKEQCYLMCEWDGCGRLFCSAYGVLMHNADCHVPDESGQLCKWPGCDGTPRSKWSLVTHIQDHHCQINQLKTAAQKRKTGHAPAQPAAWNPDKPRDVPQHPGYSRHAAIEAIRRHAFNFMPRDITDEPEGPVTKSIRLTSCLILRNIARYSAEGRHLLRRHERHLCWLALSRLESNNALAQLLAELHQTADGQPLELGNSVQEPASVPLGPPMSVSNSSESLCQTPTRVAQ